MAALSYVHAQANGQEDTEMTIVAVICLGLLAGVAASEVEIA